MNLVDIVSAAIIVDTCTMLILMHFDVGGKKVREWYRSYRIGAYMMDILSLIIGVFIATRFLPNVLWIQLIGVIVIQMAHDIAFGLFVQKNNNGGVLKLFKEYADEMGIHILWADATMMLSTVVTARALSKLNTQDSLFAGLVGSYLGLLTVYSF